MFGVSMAEDHATKGGNDNDLEEGKFNHGIEEEEDEEEGQIRYIIFLGSLFIINYKARFLTSFIKIQELYFKLRKK